MFIRIFSVAYNLLIINIIVFSYLTMAYAKTNNKFSSTPCVNKFTIYSKIKNIKNVNSLTQSNNNALDKNRTFARLINNYRINILLQYSDDSIFESDFNFRFFKQFSLQMSYFLRPYQVLEKNIPNHFNNVNQIAEKLSIYSTNLAFGFPKNKSYYIRIFAGRASLLQGIDNTGSSAHYDFNIFMNFWI